MPQCSLCYNEYPADGESPLGYCSESCEQAHASVTGIGTPRTPRSASTTPRSNTKVAPEPSVPPSTPSSQLAQAGALAPSSSSSSSKPKPKPKSWLGKIRTSPTNADADADQDKENRVNEADGRQTHEPHEPHEPHESPHHEQAAHTTPHKHHHKHHKHHHKHHDSLRKRAPASDGEGGPTSERDVERGETGGGGGGGSSTPGRSGWRSAATRIYVLCRGLTSRVQLLFESAGPLPEGPFDTTSFADAAGALLAYAQAEAAVEFRHRTRDEMVAWASLLLLLAAMLSELFPGSPAYHAPVACILVYLHCFHRSDTEKAPTHNRHVPVWHVPYAYHVYGYVVEFTQSHVIPIY